MKKRIFIATCTLLSLGSFALGQDLGSRTSSTPYDRYFGRVMSTLGSLGSNDPALDQVKDYVATGRGFRYYMKDPYIPQTPQETEASKSGDCKAKSLWVAYKMDDRSVRFIVGRVRSVRNMSHAWLLWKGPTGWLILDATMYRTPLDLDRLGPGEFTPLYSYTSGGKYVHSAAGAKKAESKYGDHS